MENLANIIDPFSLPKEANKRVKGGKRSINIIREKCKDFIFERYNTIDEIQLSMLFMFIFYDTTLTHQLKHVMHNKNNMLCFATFGDLGLLHIEKKEEVKNQIDKIIAQRVRDYANRYDQIIFIDSTYVSKAKLIDFIEKHYTQTLFTYNPSSHKKKYSNIRKKKASKEYIHNYIIEKDNEGLTGEDIRLKLKNEKEAYFETGSIRAIISRKKKNQ